MTITTTDYQEAIEAEGINYKAFKIFLDNEHRHIDENWEDRVDDFNESFAGQYDTEREWIEQLVDDTGLLIGTPEHVAKYFDYESYANDLLHGDYWETDGYYFRSY